MFDQKMPSVDRQFLKLTKWANDNIFTLTVEKKAIVVFLFMSFKDAWYTLYVDPMWGNNVTDDDLRLVEMVRENLKLLDLEHLLEMPNDDEEDTTVMYGARFRRIS